MILVGVDWSEKHHDVCVMGEAGETNRNNKDSRFHRWC